MSSNGDAIHPGSNRPTWQQRYGRFLGFRPPDKPNEPIPPLKWLHHVPLKYEVWISGFFGAMGGILLVVTVMSFSPVFRDSYNAPIIIGSFGATATLIYGVIDSPLSQPRNLVGGHIVCGVLAVCITHLFSINSNYYDNLESQEFYPRPYVNSFITMPICLLGMFITGTVHPPAGAIALSATTDPLLVALSWRFIPTVLVSVSLMLAWALIINNLGRRKYPKFWWSAEGLPAWMQRNREPAVKQDLERGVEIKPAVTGEAVLPENVPSSS